MRRSYLPINSVVKISSGKRPPEISKEKTPTCVVPVIGGGGVSGFTSKVLAKRGSFITGRVGTLGKLHVADEDCWPSDNALILRLNSEEFDNKFLRYSLSEVIDKAADLNRGAANPLLTQTDLGQLEIAAPSLDEQRQIASILGALDDKIENNRKTAATLEVMARALYRSWFVDFDPVHAKAAGEKPAFMDEETAALFPDRFGDDGLPEGWDKKAFGYLIEDTIGGDWGKESPDDKHSIPISIIRGTDFPGLFQGGRAGVPTRFSTPRKIDRRSLRPFDIVLEVSGGSPTQPTGRTILLTEAELERFDEVLVPASFCRRLRPKTRAHSIFGYLHAQQLYINGGTWKYQNQSTGISNFQTPRFLEEETVVDPGEQVLSSFRVIAEPLLARARSNENLALINLRDTLLPKLISGEIRVGEAREQVEELT